MMLLIKFDYDWPAGVRDIYVWKCERTDGWTHGRLLDCHTISSPWAFGSGALKNSDKYHKSSFFMHAVRRFMLEFIDFFFHANPWKGDTAIGNHVFVCLVPLSCAKATACYPSLKTTTTTRGLIVGFFDLKHVREPLPCPFVCGW